MTMASEQLAAERTVFGRDWADYVAHLGGPSEPDEAWECYVDEREWLIRQLADGMTIWRHVRFPSGINLDALEHSVAALGRFWTSSADVATAWVPGGTYGDHPQLVSDYVGVVLQATVGVTDVDLVETIACRMGATWESEIRLKPDRTIHLVNYEVLPDNASTPGIKA